MANLGLKVQQGLDRYCKRRAAKLGCGLTPTCLGRLQRIIATGVRRMENQNALESEVQIHVAEQNLNKLLKDMIDRATKLGTFPIVDENAFEETIRKTCPQWPFC